MLTYFLQKVSDGEQNLPSTHESLKYSCSKLLFKKHRLVLYIIISNDYNRNLITTCAGHTCSLTRERTCQRIPVPRREEQNVF